MQVNSHLFAVQFPITIFISQRKLPSIIFYLCPESDLAVFVIIFIKSVRLYRSKGESIQHTPHVADIVVIMTAVYQPGRLRQTTEVLQFLLHTTHSMN